MSGRTRRMVLFVVTVVATIAFVVAMAPHSRQWIPQGPAAAPEPTRQAPAAPNAPGVR